MGEIIPLSQSGYRQDADGIFKLGTCEKSLMSLLQTEWKGTSGWCNLPGRERKKGFCTTPKAGEVIVTRLLLEFQDNSQPGLNLNSVTPMRQS